MTIIPNTINLIVPLKSSDPKILENLSIYDDLDLENNFWEKFANFSKSDNDLLTVIDSNPKISQGLIDLDDEFTWAEIQSAIIVSGGNSNVKNMLEVEDVFAYKKYVSKSTEYLTNHEKQYFKAV